MAEQIATVNVDTAYSVSAENKGQIDSVYFDIENEPGKGWFLSSIIDCDSASFVDSLVIDDGPYPSENEAIMGGLNSAFEWHTWNSKGEIEIDGRLSEIL